MRGEDAYAACQPGVLCHRAATEAKLSDALATIDNLRTGLAEQTRLAVAWKAVAVELRKKLEERL